MDKYEYIVNLAEKTAKRVSQNRESWMKFLTSAARIYKYPFNKCSKNSPTSSGGEMNCTSEHICSKKSL